MKPNKITPRGDWKSIAVILISLLFTTGLSQAQKIPTNRLDELFDSLSAQNKAMGSITISKNGKVHYRRAIGYRFIQENEKLPADTNTMYRIASITKIFTSTIIFQLIEQGKINLNTTLDTFFPTVPNSEIITIKQMLSHRSGIHNITESDAKPEWENKSQTVTDKVEIISSFKPDFFPDDKFEYSNTNYVLLGFIIEKIIGADYGQCLQKLIIDKIGLKETFYGKGIPSRTKNESFSYKWNEGWEHEMEMDLSKPAGAGGIVSTPSDIVKFIDALFAGKLVSHNNLNQMIPLDQNHYGMGLHEIHYGEFRGIGHTGAIDASRSLLCRLPKDGLTIGYCTNGEVYMMEEVMLLVQKICTNKQYNLPQRKQSIALKEEALKKYVGVYEVNPRIDLRITLENGKLIAQVAADQPKIELFSKTPNLFFSHVDDVEVEFIIDSTGNSSHIVIIRDDGKTECKRIN